jgi:HdeA/HdeB family
MKVLIACALMLAIGPASPAAAGIETMPTRLDLERVTCGDLMAFSPDQQERALIYLTGVVDGRRRASAFDAVVAGAAIDRLLAACRATPSLLVLDTLMAATADASRTPASGR